MFVRKTARSRARWGGSSAALRAARTRRGAALRGQARDDALHVMRPRYAGLGDQRPRAAAALRGRRPPASHAGSRIWRLKQDRLREIHRAAVSSRDSFCTVRRHDVSSRADSRQGERQRRQHVAAGHDVCDVHVFLRAVEARAARPEQHGRDPGMRRAPRHPSRSSFRPSARAESPSRTAAARRARGQLVTRRQSRTEAARTSGAPRARTPGSSALQRVEDLLDLPLARLAPSPRRSSAVPSAAGSGPDSCSVPGRRR